MQEDEHDGIPTTDHYLALDVKNGSCSSNTEGFPYDVFIIRPFTTG